MLVAPIIFNSLTCMALDSHTEGSGSNPGPELLLQTSHNTFCMYLIIEGQF